MKIRLIQSVATARDSFVAGQEVEWADGPAAHLIASGAAVRVGEIPQLPSKPPAPEPPPTDGQPLLTIMVLSIKSRETFLSRLMDVLKPQITPQVELMVRVDDGEISIGRKRLEMLTDAKGRWACYIDDDDLVSADYVSRILAALEQNPDCVGFNVTRIVDGSRQGIAEHSLRHTEWSATRRGGANVMLRTPNHLNPVRTSIARQVGFHDENFGEDKLYSDGIRPLLKTEVFIDAELYIYDFRRTRPGEKTNAKPQTRKRGRR